MNMPVTEVPTVDHEQVHSFIRATWNAFRMPRITSIEYRCGESARGAHVKIETIVGDFEKQFPIGADVRDLFDWIGSLNPIGENA